MKRTKAFRLRMEAPSSFALDVVEIYVDNNLKPASLRWTDTGVDVVNTQQGLDLANVKTIYFTPRVNIPRERVRPFLEDKGIKIVRDLNKADAIITCQEFYDANIKHPYTDYVHVQGVKYFLSNFKDTCNAQMILLQMDAHLATESIKYCLLDDRNKLNVIYKDHHKNPSKVKSHWGNSYEYRYESMDFNYASIDRGSVSIIEDSSIYTPPFSAKAYDQKELINMLGETVLDKDGYESVRAMFKSQDKTNHMMAMTIMANCNYEQSFMYLALLLEEFGRNVIDNHSYKSTVAFKSLTKWMGYNKYRFDKDRIFDISIEKGLLTPELLDIIKKEYAEGSATYSNHYEVVDIRLTPEAQAKVDKIFKEKGYVDRLPSGGELLQQEVSL